MRLIDADALYKMLSLEAHDYIDIGRYERARGLERALCAIEYATTVGGWISVKDRMPDKGQDVLLQFPSNMAVGNFDHGVWFVNSGGNWNTDVCEADGDELPTHWMPLPEPSKEESNAPTDRR